jgi:hypothetical protein
MTLPDDRRRGSPRDRFRNILSAEKDDEHAPESRRPPIVKLPRVGPSAQESEARPPESVQQSPPASQGSRRVLPAFWTIGGILSVVANVVLLTMVGQTPGGVRDFGSAGVESRALTGVFSGLQKLDQAHIRTSIPMVTSLSLDASVPVKTSTRMTLARDVVISGAHVSLNAAGVSIDAPADVTLPAGTALDLNLDLVLPMSSILPVAAEIPVDIAVQDTELHGAIQELQDSLRPLLCAASPNSTLPDGTALCR